MINNTKDNAQEENYLQFFLQFVNLDACMNWFWGNWSMNSYANVHIFSLTSEEVHKNSF